MMLLYQDLQERRLWTWKNTEYNALTHFIPWKDPRNIVMLYTKISEQKSSYELRPDIHDYNLIL